MNIVFILKGNEIILFMLVHTRISMYLQGRFDEYCEN